ncbi:MAG TPA: GtrA family protein [Polyangiaceae bacterium]|jgi:putative flippase GtrA
MSAWSNIVNPRTVSKAAVSSVLATLVDGVAYQGLLFALPEHYAIVAMFGAVIGGITNFSINRRWTFQGHAGDARLQAARYALVSGLTFLALRGALWLMIDVAGISARLAWPPAKVLAFLLISYPAQRVWVFATRPQSP